MTSGDARDPDAATGSVTIDRLVDPSDPDLVALLTACVADLNERYPDYSPDPVVAGAEYFVARLDGRGVGCVGLRDIGGGRGEIKRMFVHVDGRRRGIAARLVTALEERAGERGMTSVVLETGIRQPEAIALYIAVGYTPIDAFGEYASSPLSRCFGKAVPSTRH
ncbi:GNAT family N-acetyltransferase [Williamsia herbipolensis]|uniref:GNAT family N-acetyltransferase n=1 Tax=Williamsia herbipolensis TaxID=1603258 RepID=A0AAU4K1U1_9NOCA|nr:GNAT family N-acetyltransferase [Williamsia herbipolensis]